MVALDNTDGPKHHSDRSLVWLPISNDEQSIRQKET
jgi:hypothetical protein